MGKTRYKWWGYARAMVYAFPEDDTETERDAVREALDSLAEYQDGDTRRTLVKSYFSEKKTIPQAAENAGLSPAIAELYLHDFTVDVWANFFQKLP